MSELAHLAQAVLIGLAAWRLAALVSYERGPFDMFLRVRKFAGFEHNEAGEPETWPETFLAGLLSCVWCLSIWMAGITWLLWQLDPLIVVVLAAAALVPVIERWARR